ncbi:MAG: hypothetical protein O2816_05380 [Planctomycetota bacterium]|nr:hypothetical protein [Planctomycetota bacterium]
MMSQVPAHALLLLPLALACSRADQEEPSQTESSSPIARQVPQRLLPKGTVALVALPSISHFEEAVNEVVVLLDLEDTPTAPPQAVAELLALMGVAGDLSLLDRDRPLLVALTMVEVPQPAFLLPVTDTAAFRDSLDPGTPVTIDSGYALVGAKPGDGAQSSLLEDLPSGRIGLRVDLAALGPMILAMTDEVLSSADGGEMPAGMEMDAFLELAQAFIGEFVASSRTFDLSLHWDAGRLGLSARLDLIEGSSLAGWITEKPTGVAALAHTLDPDAAMSFLGGIDPEVVREKMMPMVRRLSAIYPDGLREALLTSLDQVEEHYDHIGSAFAGTQDFGPNGLRYSYVLAPADPDATVAAMIKMFRSPGFDQLGYEMGEPELVELGGATFQRLPMKFDLDKMNASLEGLTAPGSAAEIEEMMSLMFGEGLELTVGAVDKYVIAQVGGGADLATVLARVRGSSKPDASVEALLRKHGSASPVMLARIDMARLLRTAMDLVAPQEAAGIEIDEDAEVEMILHAVGRGHHLDFGFEFDLAAMVELVQGMQK